MRKDMRNEFILLLAVGVLLVGCWRRDVTYDGDDPELFSVALHSLLGTRGFQEGHQGVPYILVLQEDNYGRILFSYLENSIDGLLIIQKIDGDYAYFYPHYNFILNYGVMPSPAPDNFSFGFTEEEIGVLRDTNRWEQPMSDVSEFERVPIIQLKEEGPISLEILNEAYSGVFPETVDRLSSSNVIFRMNFLRIDRYGRSVYFASHNNFGNFAILFQPDHSFDLETGAFEITDMNNYQTELRLFMESNGWNEPWED